NEDDIPGIDGRWIIARVRRWAPPNLFVAHLAVPEAPLVADLFRGALEIFSRDGTLYSRFIRDKKTGLIIHTNDPDTPSTHGQFMYPEVV
ncbi:MAG: hypothetical protein ACK2UM_02985, partial [Anaerolineales bacterium]